MYLMRHIKSYKIFKLNESVNENIINHILLELKDDESYNIDVKLVSNPTFPTLDIDYLEIYIRKRYGLPGREIDWLPIPPGDGKYPGDLFFWKEIKDVVISLCKYYYSETEYTPGINSKTINDLEKIGITSNPISPFRMFSSGTEFGIGWYCEDDFKHLSDSHSFTSFKILMKL